MTGRNTKRRKVCETTKPAWVASFVRRKCLFTDDVTNITFTSPPPFCSPLSFPLSLSLTSFPPFIILQFPLPPFLHPPQARQLSWNPQRTRRVSRAELHRLCARPLGTPSPESPGWRKARKSAPSALRWALMRDSQISEQSRCTPACAQVNTGMHKHNSRDKTLYRRGRQTASVTLSH